MKNITDRIYKALTNPKRAIWELREKYAIRKKNWPKLCDLRYRRVFGQNINWHKPQDLNQWIASLQFSTDTTLWSTLADKYAVHDYLSERGYGDYLVPILAKWDTPDEISFENLPDRFVLKCNNGSGDIMVIDDKNNIDISKVRDYFKEILGRDFMTLGPEPHYGRIKPCIIAEEMLDNEKQSVPSSSLIDYKFWCFNGKVDRVFVCSDRSKDGFTIDLYDSAAWGNIADGNLVYDAHHHKSSSPMPKPQNLRLMKDIASRLSKGFPEMRVDFYEVGGKPYIGELTMTSACGRMNYFTPECLTEMGKLCADAVQELSLNLEKD